MCIWEVPIEKRQCLVCNVHNCNDRKYTGRRGGKVMPTMRDMEVNQSHSFSIIYDTAIRTAACVLKRDCDMFYARKTIGDKIIVVRVK